ncbi:GPW/gp25 family protein [Pseudoalteromonas sp. MMG012]|uniref:GPW/gp25 family protein n=1 Tax=Pseudoalteromonas sp. MMG012 TaxID=2822686 RepID=UPI001B3A49C3|nr:GPW/gp25 family protein [Pseudoalteromonas sp. MMG012]MBQ4852412.1 GPW/gp25 family protein [Pseudoalteromonas sp. MMG012]
MSQSAFLGQGWAFPPRFGTSESGPAIASGEVLLQQAIYLALHTLIGERPLWPEMGSGLSSFTFAEAAEQSLADLKQEIATVLLNYEPRITLQDIVFDSSALYDGILTIELQYLIRQTNSRSNMVFPFYLLEQSV